MWFFVYVLFILNCSTWFYLQLTVVYTWILFILKFTTFKAKIHHHDFTAPVSFPLVVKRNPHQNTLTDTFFRQLLDKHCLCQLYSRYLCCDHSTHELWRHFVSFCLPLLIFQAQNIKYNWTMKLDRMFLWDELWFLGIGLVSTMFDSFLNKFPRECVLVALDHSQWMTIRWNFLSLLWNWKCVKFISLLFLYLLFL